VKNQDTNNVEYNISLTEAIQLLNDGE